MPANKDHPLFARRADRNSRYILYTRNCDADRSFASSNPGKATGKSAEWQQTGGEIVGKDAADRAAKNAKKTHGCQTKLERIA